MGEVKLLGSWTSPFVMRARIALNIKSVEYEFMEETLQFKSELLLKSNPVYKQIPVLIHGGNPISQSLIIVQYIDQVWSSSAPSILSSRAYDRAIQRFWASYIDDQWYPSLGEIGRAQGEEAKAAAAAEKVKEGLALLEDAFEECSKGKALFGGDQIGYLDIALGSNLGWLRVVENLYHVKLLDEAIFPHLTVWARTFCAHPAVNTVMPQTRNLLEFAKIMMAA